MQFGKTMSRSLAASMSMSTSVTTNASFVRSTTSSATAFSSSSFPPPDASFIVTTKYSTAVKSSEFKYRNSQSFSTSSLSASASSSVGGTEAAFEAPVPPSFNGQPIYPDVPISSSSSTTTLGITEIATKRNEDADAVFVVTGASRGIGLEMVKSLLQRTKGTILACCRSTSPESNPKLQSFLQSLPPSSSSRIHIVPLDLQNQDTITQLAQTIQSSYGKRVDGLFNVAGILGDNTESMPGPERSIRTINRDWMTQSMEVNYIGPIMLCQALTPLMKKNTRKSPNDKSIIVNLSARVGSISDNGLGGWISYRCSKSALNQATRTMAHELKRQGTWTVALHPGTTDTDLSKPFQGNVQEGRLFPVEFTVNQLMNVVEAMEEDHSGGFYDWAGKALPF